MIYTTEDAKRNRLRMTQFTTANMSDMEHAGTRALYDYWTSLRAGRIAPRKAEITAEGVGRALAGNTFILESLGGGNMRFRLAGSALFDIFGLEMRGMSALSTMIQEERAKFRSLLEAVLTKPCIGLLHLSASTPSGAETKAEMLLSPIKSDFDEMNRVLGVIHLLQDEEVETASRRCRIDALRVLPIEGATASLIEGPMAGFAEPAAAFTGGPQASPSRPAASPEAAAPFTSIDGGAQASEDGSERRRGHLRLVKE